MVVAALRCATGGGSRFLRLSRTWANDRMDARSTASTTAATMSRAIADGVHEKYSTAICGLTIG